MDYGLPAQLSTELQTLHLTDILTIGTLALLERFLDSGFRA